MSIAPCSSTPVLQLEAIAANYDSNAKEKKPCGAKLPADVRRMALQYSNDRAVLDEALRYMCTGKYDDALRVLNERKPHVDECSLDQYEGLISYAWFRLGDMRQAINAARVAVRMGLSSSYLDAITAFERLAPDE